MDEEADAQGLPKKARVCYINYLEGRSYVHPAEPHLNLQVNDDQDEKNWAEVLNLMIGGAFTNEMSRVFDDLTGKELDAESVREARGDEMEFVKGLGVYEEALIQECLDRTGKRPIGTRSRESEFSICIARSSFSELLRRPRV